jgi:hypothetical protein
MKKNQHNFWNAIYPNPEHLTQQILIVNQENGKRIEILTINAHDATKHKFVVKKENKIYENSFLVDQI